MRDIFSKIKKAIASPTHMQLSLFCFVLALGLSLFLWIRSVTSRGSLSVFEGALGVAAALFSAAGFVIPLYGHFIVGAAEKKDYRRGLALNGVLFLLLVFFYFLGL